MKEFLGEFCVDFAFEISKDAFGEIDVFSVLVGELLADFEDIGDNNLKLARLINENRFFFEDVGSSTLLPKIISLIPEIELQKLTPWPLVEIELLEVFLFEFETISFA
jgi:hypothetical protein